MDSRALASPARVTDVTVKDPAAGSAVTDFPDIRTKYAIYSANQGNALIIPREGGYLVRFYIELDKVSDKEMLDNRSVTPEKLAKVANRLLHPYQTP